MDRTDDFEYLRIHRGIVLIFVIFSFFFQKIIYFHLLSFFMKRKLITFRGKKLENSDFQKLFSFEKKKVKYFLQKKLLCVCFF